MTAALLASNGYSASDALSTRRVPAWKRLGLKLKYEDEDDQHTELLNKDTTRKKRVCDQDAQNLPEAIGLEHGLRKQRRLEPPSAQPKTSNTTEVKDFLSSLRRDTNSTRKTVSFTSDTKVEDGDSSKSLIADWEAQYDQSSPSAKLPINPDAPKQRASKPKKAKSHPATKKPHAALAYLTRFRESRNTWKFNKSTEIWILKHLFSVDDIPSDYDISLSQYLQGLKSASTRSRIRQAAEELIKEDLEKEVEYKVSTDEEADAGKSEIKLADMEDPERRRVYYEDSIRRYKRKLEQHLEKTAEEELSWVSPERLAKRRRAEITLWAIGVTPTSAEATQGSDTTMSDPTASPNANNRMENGGASKDLSKKRKNRTSVIDLSSSSSSDEGSDSSTESDNDEGGGSGSTVNRSDSGSTSTTTRTQSSTSGGTEQTSGTDGGTESSSSSGESSDDSDSEPKNSANTKGRPRSVISISS